MFGDLVVAPAILGPLLHHYTVITTQGDNYLLCEKRRSGLLQETETSLETNQTVVQ
ncbi:MAG: hypothetical protein NVS3B5_13890 [Sphingomicrobium sp.]